MTIDWDKIADDAENTPRGVLSSLLAEADVIDTLVVIATKPSEDDGDEWFYQTSGSAVKALGVLRAATLALEKHVLGDEQT